MKQLGKTDLKVNPIGLGCMGLSHAYGDAVSVEYANDFLAKAFEYGYNFFDTAEVYNGTTEDGTTSNNEELVGGAIQSFRDEILTDEGKIIGFGFMDMFTKAGWLDKVNFDCIIDGTLLGVVKK